MEKNLIYKKQIAGFQDVEATVKVVEKAAASYIHSLKRQTESLLKYKKEIQLVLARILEFGNLANHSLLQKRQAGPKAILVIGGDKGIVAGLHHNLVSLFLEHKNSYQKIWVLGKKLKEYLTEEHLQIREFTYGMNKNKLPQVEEVHKLNRSLINIFQQEGLSALDILYPQFISLVKQRPLLIKFLPFNLENNLFLKTSKSSQGLPIFEPSKKRFFDSLLKKYININLTEIIFEAKLSEFSARTVAAEEAVSKIEEILLNLKLTFFKARKRLLTQKQLESFISHQTI